MKKSIATCNMKKRYYASDGYRAESVKRPFKRTIFYLAAAICLLLIPLIVMLDIREDTAVAEWWTTHIQFGWEKSIGTLTDWLPFSVLELLIVSGIILGIYLFVRMFVNLCKARFRRICVGLLWILAGGAYLINLYIMSMGFGYYRAEMPIPQAGEDYTVEQATAVIEYFLEDYNNLSNSLKRDKNGCVICPYSFSELSRVMKKEYSRLDDKYFSSYTPNAKPIVNSWFLSDMLITGITFLPMGEAGVNTVAPPTSVTATMAHELAHTKGIQREGDANLLARYILLSSDDDYLRYCGYYSSFDNLLSVLYLAGDYDTYNKLGSSISQLVYKERRYARDYWNSQPDFIGKLAEFFNNLYLKSNGASNGTGSYDDGNKSDVIIPTDPSTGEPERDPETGDIIRIIQYSQVQMMYFWIYENKVK